MELLLLVWQCGTVLVAIFFVADAVDEARYGLVSPRQLVGNILFQCLIWPVRLLTTVLYWSWYIGKALATNRYE